MDYLSGLNERQKEAVLHKDGPIMIVAGAGSGKNQSADYPDHSPDGRTWSGCLQYPGADFYE